MGHIDDFTMLNLLSEALERVGDGFARVGADGRIMLANPALADMFARTRDDLIGQNISALFVDHEQAHDERVLTQGVFSAPYDRTHAYQLTAIRADGTRFPAEILFAGAHAPSGVRQWVIRDVSTRMELTRLRLNEERYRSSQTFANIGTWDWQVETDDLHWSDEVAPMFGLPRGTKPTYELFCNAVHPDDRQHVRENEIACEQRNEKHDVEYRVVWPDGTVRWLRETGNLLRDENGTARRMIGVVRDITEQKQAEQHYQYMAHHDPLTGLPNRGLFEQRLDMILKRAARHNVATALMFIDLGKFKAINDSFGHLVGDKVLVAVAERLKETVRETDMVARIGGDEFVVILEDVHNAEELRTLAQKLLDHVTQPMNIDGITHDIQASLGASVCPGNAKDGESLIQSADEAMYAAKVQGGNGFKLAGET